VVELVPVTGTDAVLLCRDGSVHRTVDGGRRWVPVTAQPGATALAWQSGGRGWLLVDTDDGCPSLTLVRTTDGGGTWSPGGCVGRVPVAVDDVRQPSVDFVDPEVGMAVVAGEVFTTRDAGYSWRLVG
jgi:photosystem II stability/assembly factor-like uncharacterized protein